MMASVHIDPRITIPAALVLAGLLIWYWFRLGRSSIPPPRRRVRRWSMVFMFASLPPFVRALSFVDHRIEGQAREYVLLWTAIFIIILLVIATAIIDAIVSVRLQQQLMEREITKAGGELARLFRDGDAVRSARDQDANE